MDERVLTPSTSVLTVLVVGMVAGHTLMPARPGALATHRVGFVLAVAAAGALGGWRVARLRRPSTPSVSLGGAVAGIVIALGVAALGYAIVHG